MFIVTLFLYFHVFFIAEAPNIVKLYDDILNGPLSDFVQISEKIGGDVGEIVLIYIFLLIKLYGKNLLTSLFLKSMMTKCAFEVQRVFLWKACGLTKPNDEQMSTLLKPTSDKIESIVVHKMFLNVFKINTNPTGTSLVTVITADSNRQYRIEPLDVKSVAVKIAVIIYFYSEFKKFETNKPIFQSHFGNR